MSESRSLSFTRSSPTRRNTVVPAAREATTASSGISSISEGISCAGTSVARSDAGPACRSPTGSPQASVPLLLLMRAPIRSSTARNPVRVGLSPTPVIASAPDSASSAAPTRKAADDGSPGTWMSKGSIRPVGAKWTQPSRSSIPKPNAPSRRSEWSRERPPGSRNESGCRAAMAANSSEPFTWALETGSSHRSGPSAPPRMVSGRVSGWSGTNRAPMRSNGSVTRRIGRRRSDASPVSVARNRCAASNPSSRRAAVPALPQSRRASGARRRPEPWISTTEPGRRGEMAAPSARRHRAVDLASSEVKAPPTWLLPLAIAASMSSRWVMLLSPGTRTVPPTFMDRLRARDLPWLRRFAGRTGRLYLYQTAFSTEAPAWPPS